MNPINSTPGDKSIASGVLCFLRGAHYEENRNVPSYMYADALHCRMQQRYDHNRIATETKHTITNDAANRAYNATGCHHHCPHRGHRTDTTNGASHHSPGNHCANSTYCAANQAHRTGACTYMGKRHLHDA